MFQIHRKLVECSKPNVFCHPVSTGYHATGA